MTWEEIIPLLPDRPGYNNLEIGLRKKQAYIDRHLPEIKTSAYPLRILDIGAGTGFFCKCCKNYGHNAVAVLRPGRPWTEGYKASCKFLEVSAVLCEWGENPDMFPAGMYHVVNSEGMLGMNPVGRWEALLNEMFRVLRVKGLLMLVVNAGLGLKHQEIIRDWAEESCVLEIEHKRNVWKWEKLQ